ncbi:hypothetical protein O0L34_g16128 [Tuta absoluta]|nr:hypothetical protein O0L34_g16128 [Tuta absoluta]
MASDGSPSSRLSPARGASGPGAGASRGGGGDASSARPHHARGFKLRFAAPREPGRSDVSLVKPLGLPATVAGKFYARGADAAPAPADVERAAAALRRVRDKFQCGPREKHDRSALSSHEYGWWWDKATPADPWLRHHIRDSPWMRERLRLLAPQHAR